MSDESRREETVSIGEFRRLQADYQTTLEALQEQIDGAAALHEQISAYQEQVSELEEAAGRAEELEGTLSGMKHEQTFADIAKELGIKPEAIKDAYKLGGWEAKGDPDAKAMKDHFSKALEGRDYLKATAEGNGTPKRLPADEHGGRGPGAPRGDGKFRATNAQLNDVNWMDNNIARIAEATMRGDFELTDS